MLSYSFYRCDKFSVPSLRSQTSHDKSSRAPSCQVVMGTMYPSPVCFIVPRENAVHLWFPGARLETKPISPKLSDNIRVGNCIREMREGADACGIPLNKLYCLGCCVEAEKGNKHISFRLMRGCALGHRMLWSRCLRSGSSYRMNNIISPRWCVQVSYYSSRCTILKFPHI